MTIDTAFIVRLLLAAMAIYRVAWFAKEDGPFGIFSAVRVWLGKQAADIGTHGLFWTLAEIANCPHCFGVWLAMLAVPAVLFPNIFTDVLILMLAIAGLQSFLTRATSEE